MKRFDGRDLGPNPHIAILGSSKVGNFVVTVPLIQALKLRYPNSVIDFCGSELTQDFEDQLDHIAWRISWDCFDSEHFLRLASAFHQRTADVGAYDLLINCDGFNPVTQLLGSWLRPHFVAGAVLSQNARGSFPWGEHPYQRFLQDSDWDSPDFLARYPSLFKSNYIAELLCRLVFLELPNTPIDLPSQPPLFDTPDILIHVTTTRAAKLWPLNFWLQVLNWCHLHSFAVGLVGSPPKLQRDAYNAGDLEEVLLEKTNLQDLRGKTSLIQLAGASKQAKAVVSVDAGPMHISAAVGTPTLAIVGNDNYGVGASPIRLWMPRSPNCERTVSSVSCDACAVARFRNDHCLKEHHECMNAVSPDQVIHWLGRTLLVDPNSQ